MINKMRALSLVGRIVNLLNTRYNEPWILIPSGLAIILLTWLWGESSRPLRNERLQIMIIFACAAGVKGVLIEDLFKTLFEVRFEVT